MKRTLLIDGDTLAYQQSILGEIPVEWGDGFWTLHSVASEVIAAIEDRISHLKADLDADTVVIALSDSQNWRKEILPSYKANRVKIRKPLCLGAVREWLLYEHKAKIVPQLEADDVIGITATENIHRDTEFVIVGVDKDYNTVPAKQYNPNKPDLGITHPSSSEADKFWMMQTLSGDAADGYKGCAGIGPKKAEQILAKCNSLKEMWIEVVKAYEKSGMSIVDALVNARVSRILRFGDYNSKSRKIKIWNPEDE